MKLAILTFALLLASGRVQAHPDKHGVQIHCDIGSQYSISTYRRAFLFTQDGQAPARIGIGGGRLFIAGREETLTAADHQRLIQFESEMHQLIPEMRRVTVEAVDIAFIALSEVARGLSSTPQATMSSLESAHRRVRLEMGGRSLALFNDDAMAAVVKPILVEYVPQIVGGAVSAALKAVFAGEKERQQFQIRMDRMKNELDTRVDARAKTLEPLAEAMCQRLRRMDGLDNALEFRLPDGEPLQLLRVDSKEKADAP